jgi:putative transposase
LGKRPPGWVEDQYEWIWVYGAVEPITGYSFFLLLPRVDSICMEYFLKELKAEIQSKKGKEEVIIGILLDGAPSHISQQVEWPEDFQPIPLPGYSPEVNPAEQIFRILRDRLPQRVYENLEDLLDTLSQTIRDFQDDPSKIISLTAYPWWKQALQQDDIPSFAA